jgi:hypothetical protein
MICLNWLLSITQHKNISLRDANISIELQNIRVLISMAYELEPRAEEAYEHTEFYEYSIDN